jgi:hypothetical protein
MLIDMTKRLAGSVAELIDGYDSRDPMVKPGDSLSGSHFERVVIDGEAYVLKHMHVDNDWIQRVTGDVFCLPVRVWSSGIADRVAHVIDDTIEGCAVGLGRNGWGAALLMRDVGDRLVPEGSDHVSWEQHRRFLAHMAELHAAYWGYTDEVGLLPMGNRYRLLTPLTTESERALRTELDPVPASIPSGWERFMRDAPRSASVVAPLVADPSPLVDALERLPQTLVHSDWKLGNLGSHPDGRTILIDWAWPGRAPACVDIAWYLGVNCDRLPVSKEVAIETYRSDLERLGVDTEPWWDAALGLALLGAFVQLGWSKTGEELAWWDERAEGWSAHL